jgi:hypothetical protein
MGSSIGGCRWCTDTPILSRIDSIRVDRLARPPLHELPDESGDTPITDGVSPESSSN